MDSCAICGKASEGTTIEIDDESMVLIKKHVCNSCSEVIAEIAFQTVHGRIQSLVRDVEQLKNFVADLKRKYPKGSNFQEHVSRVGQGSSSNDDPLSETDESYEDEDFEDDEVSNDEKGILALSNDALADEMLTFAKEMSPSDDSAELLSDDVVQLFWKSKGIRNTYTLSAEGSIKIRQAEKVARDKIIADIFSASNDELARELADFAKKLAGKVNGQGVYVQSASHTFWRSKGLDYRSHSVDIEIRKNKIEQLAQEVIDKDFREWRDKRLQMETKYLPQLTKACVEWALRSGRSSVTIKDVKYFRQEKKIELLEATERALYVSANNELKSLKKTRR